MKERKILIGLEKFTVSELNAFRKYLISPFFNQNERIIALFDLIDDCLRHQKDFYAMTNEEIWQKVNGNMDGYADVRLRKLFSDLFGLFEDYIMQVEIRDDESQYLFLKLKAYKNRNLKELYSSAIQQVEVANKTKKNKSAEYYLNQYNEQKKILEFNVQGHIVNRKEDLNEKLNIEEVSINLDVFYIAEKLKYYCNYLSWNRSYKLDKRIIGIEVILKLAQSSVFRDYPPIAVYYTISKTITEENNTEHYYKLKDLIKKYLHLFTPEEAKEIFESAINYTVTKSNRGDANFNIETFELYKNGLVLDIFFENNTISPTNFRNIVLYGLRCSELNWVENFINEFSVNLHPKFRESNVNFSLARVQWHKKDFRKVIEYLAYTEYTEVFQALLSRTLLLLSYYELDEMDSLESLFSSFKLYLDREKTLIKERKAQYYNLIKYTRSLVKLDTKEKIKILKLKQEIESTESVVNKAWLLEKIEDKLKKK